MSVSTSAALGPGTGRAGRCAGGGASQSLRGENWDRWMGSTSVLELGRRAVQKVLRPSPQRGAPMTRSNRAKLAFSTAFPARVH